MKRILLIAVLLFSCSSFSKNIGYGYNAMGDYVPTSIGNENIGYGYNAMGDYVPTSIGDIGF